MEIKQTKKDILIDQKNEELSNVDAEIALIGCLLRENKYYENIADFLLPEHFTNPLNAKLFSIIAKMIDQAQLVSPITLKNYFSSSKEQFYMFFCCCDNLISLVGNFKNFSQVMLHWTVLICPCFSPDGVEVMGGLTAAI